MLSVVVVGGGPTGVEFAAEMHDFLTEDVPKLYPRVKDKVRHHLGAVRGSHPQLLRPRISAYAGGEVPALTRIEVITGARVLSVSPDKVVVMDKRTKKKGSRSSAQCVWSTGLGKRAFVAAQRRRLLQAARARARGRRAPASARREGVYAIGDCADVKSAEDPNTPGMKVLELTDVASALFKQADTDGRRLRGQARAARPAL